MRGLIRVARAAAAIAPIAVLPLLGGCYTFAAAAPEAVSPGARVRVALSDAGATALVPQVGASVTGVEGDLLQLRGDTVVVRPERLLTAAGVDVEFAGERLNIPGPWRSGIDRRRLARGRTAALVVGGAALSAGFVALIRASGGGDASGGGGEPIRLRLGRP